MFTANEEFFNGHFPNHPVMPGVLIIEALAQTAAIFAFMSHDSKLDKDAVVYFATIDSARFKRPVEPGDQLVHGSGTDPQLERHVEIQDERSGGWPAGGRSRVDVRHSGRCSLPESRFLMAIHPTAIIDPHAELDSSVEVGAYSIIGPDVRIGARTRIGPHVVIEGHTTIGEDNHIFQFASLGG